MSETTPPTTLPELTRLRRRLTLWYIGTSAVILVLLGGSALWVIQAPGEGERHDSLRSAVADAAHKAGDGTGNVPSRLRAESEHDGLSATVQILTADGQPTDSGSNATFEPWVREAVARAVRDGHAEAEHDGPGNATSFLYAERIGGTASEPRVALAVMSDVELEDQYESVLAAVVAATLFAILIVAVGGWTLVRVSTAPIEASIGQMRRFVADAAHELRTPITVLRSRTDVALQQPRDSATYVATLQHIDTDARRLAAIVDDLFVLARADAGERQRAHDRIALDDIVVDAANTAKVVAERKSVSLSLPEYEEAWVNGDARMLRQLVMILLDNAIKFTPVGGSVSVRVRSIDERATVTVEDTGIGIAREHLPHVFDRFYRADQARQPIAAGDDGQSGAGLGLSIARWIADLHGAEIVAESEQEKGTRMTLRFPAVGPPGKAAAANA